MIQRRLVNTETPEGHPGFLGAGHIARRVVGGDFSQTDPFIFLMDDRLDKKDNEPVGGPHPHAGFETVTFVVDGEFGEGEHKMKAGDFELMTAGSGVVHTETIDKKTKLRILQLWLNLPKNSRKATPRLQHLDSEQVPTKNENGATIKVYSGLFAGLTSPVQNYVPMILADITLATDATTIQQLPADFNAFIYVLNGRVQVGDSPNALKEGQVGWLDLSGENVGSELKLLAGPEGARLVLYAGKPTHDTIVSQGPFIAGTKEDIKQLFVDYWTGKMEHINEVPESQRIVYG